MQRFNKKLIAVAISAAVLGLTACKGEDGDNGTNGVNGADGATGAQGPAGAAGATGAQGAAGQDLTEAPKLIRIATTPLGAEVTGLFKTDNGDLFFNVQHPSDTLPAPENNSAVGVVEGLDFDNVDPRLADLAVPSTDAEKQTIMVAGSATYNALGRADDIFAGALPNGLGAINQGTNGASPGAELKQSQDPDFNAFVATAADGSAGYLFSAWEDRPGAMSRLKVNRSLAGNWSVDTSDVIEIDFSSVNGTMINCFGSLSPWGTPLTSEENYEAENAENWINPSYTDGYPNITDVRTIRDYNGLTSPALNNPYDYGYIVEITNPTSATPVPVKHFTLGRMAHENAVVMPDHKTVYLTDDGTDKGFYKFVADTAGDLSSGKLYAAKITQDATSDTAKAGFDIEWMFMGASDNATIEVLIDSYDGVTENDYDGVTVNFVSDADLTAWAADMLDNGVIDSTDASLPFIETLRAARALGATTEFRKMEGININYDGAAAGTIPFMYVAMSEVRSGMTDGAGDIQLTENRCGVVYRLGLQPDYNTIRMEPAVVGGPYDGANTANKCSVDSISQPDNVLVLDDGRVIIGEDTGNHENNMIWLYNPAGK